MQDTKFGNHPHATWDLHPGDVLKVWMIFMLYIGPTHTEFHQLLWSVFLLYSCTTAFEHHPREWSKLLLKWACSNTWSFSGCSVLNQAFAICSSANYKCYRYPQLYCKEKKAIKAHVFFPQCIFVVYEIKTNTTHHTTLKSHSRKTTSMQVFTASYLAISQLWFLGVQNVLCIPSKRIFTTVPRITHTS